MLQKYFPVAWKRESLKRNDFVIIISVLETQDKKQNVQRRIFVFELQNFIFERGLAEKLRFWASKLHFWRMSRKSFVFELQSFIFESSLAQKLRFLSFQVWILKEVSQKRFVLQLQSVNFEGSLAEKFCFGASKLHFWRKFRRKGNLRLDCSLCLETSATALCGRFR